MPSDAPAAMKRSAATIRPGAPDSAVRVRAGVPVAKHRPLSIVERHSAEGLPCLHAECTSDDDAAERVIVPLPIPHVMLLCATCAKLLPRTGRMSLAKGGR